MNKLTTAALFAESTAVQKQTNVQLQYTTSLASLPTTRKATPLLQACARYLTVGRQQGKHRAAPSASIGTPAKDFEATYYGTLAELVLYQWLEVQGATPNYILLDRMPVTKPDFVMDGVAYEVKCSPPGKKYLAISQRQHLNPARKPDFYLCAVFETPDTIRFCAPVPHSEVEKWRLMTNGHAPYYSASRASLVGCEASAPQAPRLQLDASEFFSTLFSNYPSDGLRLEIRPLYPQWHHRRGLPDGTRRWFSLTPEGIREATSHAQRLAGLYDVFFGVLPRLGREGKSEAVNFAGCLWCDIDGGSEGVEGAQSLLDRAVDGGKIPTPTFTVISGNGLHTYWKLAEPVPLDSDGRMRFKQTLQRLCRVIGGGSPLSHADSSRADVASLLRVPHTFNRKVRETPLPVHFKSTGNGDAPQSLVWWKAHLPALPCPPLPKPMPLHPSRDVTLRLSRWAAQGYQEGERHPRLVRDARWLVHTVGLDKSQTLNLLMMKANASTGSHPVSEQELKGIVQWA